MENKDINLDIELEEAYEKFSEENIRSFLETLIFIVIFIAITIVSFFVANILVEFFNIDTFKGIEIVLNNNPSPQDKNILYSVWDFLITLLVGIIFISLGTEFILNKLVNELNSRLKERNNKKKFLDYYLKNEKKSFKLYYKIIKKFLELIEKINNLIKKIDWFIEPLKKTIKLTKRFILIIFASFSLVFGSEIINLFFLDNMSFQLKLFIFIIVIFLFLRRENKKNSKNRKLEIEKSKINKIEYVKKYIFEKEILDKILISKNKQLTINSISKKQYENLKKELKKIEYFYKKNKLIICIKIEYLKIYLEKEKGIKIDVENIENESKLKNIDYIYDNEEKSIVIIVKILN